jgi:hypothetical protein
MDQHSPDFLEEIREGEPEACAVFGGPIGDGEEPTVLLSLNLNVIVVDV